MIRLKILLFALLAASLLTAACGDDEPQAGSPPSIADGVTEVVRQVLTGATPSAAEGQVLELTRVIIPAGEGIPAHTHPGEQLAVIVSGTLTYTIIDGEAEVTRAAGTADEQSQTYSSGDQIQLRVGDAIHEPMGMVHEAANETDGPVIIYLSSLFSEGEPPATLVE